MILKIIIKKKDKNIYGSWLASRRDAGSKGRRVQPCCWFLMGWVVLVPSQITICRNDECVLEDNSQRTKWKVISPTGNEAMVPSVCFLIPPPNKEAIEMANR